jgi:hypothetical protein
MRYRALDQNGDMTFGNGQNNFLIDSPAAIAQAVKTSLLLFMGEWYLNVNDGTPYFESILGYHSQAEADQAIQSQILGVQVIVSSTNIPSGATAGQIIPGVTSIINYVSSIDPISRAYSSSCTINTIYGPTPLEIANYQNF